MSVFFGQQQRQRFLGKKKISGETPGRAPPPGRESLNPRSPSEEGARRVPVGGVSRHRASPKQRRYRFLTTSAVTPRGEAFDRLFGGRHAGAAFPVRSTHQIDGRARRSGPPKVSGGSAFGNDPSAGSPTETLLRLLLPLDGQVRSSSRRTARAREEPRRGRSKDLTKPPNR